MTSVDSRESAVTERDRAANGVLPPGHFIDGAWRPARAAAGIPVLSPSTGELLGTIADATGEEVDAAVAAARVAFETGEWVQTSPAERATVIERAAGILLAQAESLGRLVTLEMGAPIRFSGTMAQRASDAMRYYAGLARDLAWVERRDDVVPALVVREPVGVVAAVAPWNGPVGMAVTKIIPALLAGCSVVFKPAPETPYDIAFLVEALAEAGLPAGVLNVVTGGLAAGQALTSHRDVDMISFTGSTAAGVAIAATRARDFTRLQLELGGKSAAIVLDDADPQAVAAGIGGGTFFNTGQVCAALSRVIVPRQRYDEFVEVLKAAAESWVVGDPFDPATTVGPLVSQRQHDRVSALVDAAVRSGARAVTGGGTPPGLDRGAFFAPTVLADVDNTMPIARDEIFGPVAVVIPHDGIEDAVAISNDSDYGLHGAVFTADPQAALDVARRIRTGAFSINAFIYNNRAPFGGVKQSGVGRDSGREGLEAFTELKTINLDGPTSAYPLS